MATPAAPNVIVRGCHYCLAPMRLTLFNARLLERWWWSQGPAPPCSTRKSSPAPCTSFPLQDVQRQRSRACGPPRTWEGGLGHEKVNKKEACPGLQDGSGIGSCDLSQAGSPAVLTALHWWVSTFDDTSQESRGDVTRTHSGPLGAVPLPWAHFSRQLCQLGPWHSQRLAVWRLPINPVVLFFCSNYRK